MFESLNMRFLGGCSITRDDTCLSGLLSAKAQALLCYLAVSGGRHSRSRIAGLLWSDLSEERARANLRVCLTHLRPQIGRHLSITRQTLALDASHPYWLDVKILEDAAANLDQKPLPVQALQRAADLYRGDFLDDFHVGRATLFDEWVLARRERFRMISLRLFDTLTAYFVADQEHASALAYAQRMLLIEPWREETHRQLMLLYARTGQPRAALAQWGICRQVLAQELGVQPAADTVALFQALREGAALTPAVGRPTQPRLLPRRDNPVDISVIALRQVAPHCTPPGDTLHRPGSRYGPRDPLSTRPNLHDLKFDWIRQCGREVVGRPGGGCGLGSVCRWGLVCPVGRRQLP